jgi:hypothetical protein
MLNTSIAPSFCMSGIWSPYSMGVGRAKRMESVKILAAAVAM